MDDLEMALKKVAQAIQKETKHLKVKRDSYSIDIDRDMVREPVSETHLDLLIRISPKLANSLEY